MTDYLVRTRPLLNEEKKKKDASTKPNPLNATDFVLI
jgi:hypothetical protein